MIRTWDWCLMLRMEGVCCASLVRAVPCPLAELCHELEWFFLSSSQIPMCGFAVPVRGLLLPPRLASEAKCCLYG